MFFRTLQFVSFRATRAINEAWRQFEMKHKPGFVICLEMKSGMFDINLTPDKRQVLLTHEQQAVAQLKEHLQKLWEPSRNVFQATRLDDLIAMTPSDVIVSKNSSARSGVTKANSRRQTAARGLKNGARNDNEEEEEDDDDDDDGVFETGSLRAPRARGTDVKRTGNTRGGEEEEGQDKEEPQTKRRRRGRATGTGDDANTHMAAAENEMEVGGADTTTGFGSASFMSSATHDGGEVSPVMSGFGTQGGFAAHFPQSMLADLAPNVGDDADVELSSARDEGFASQGALSFSSALSGMPPLRPSGHKSARISEPHERQAVFQARSPTISTKRTPAKTPATSVLGGQQTDGHDVTTTTDVQEAVRLTARKPKQSDKRVPVGSVDALEKKLMERLQRASLVRKRKADLRHARISASQAQQEQDRKAKQEAEADGGDEVRWATDVIAQVIV
jgi:DNA mismatch repair ATPase MutL